MPYGEEIVEARAQFTAELSEIVKVLALLPLGFYTHTHTQYNQISLNTVQKHSLNRDYSW